MTPLTDRERVQFSRAATALREAESVAKIEGVAGPADAEPDSKEEAPGWIADWKARAKSTMQRAYQWWSEGNRRLRERAQEIARQVKRGARAIRRASPGEYIRQKLQGVVDTAQTLTTWATVAEVGLTAALIWAAWKLFFKRGR